MDTIDIDQDSMSKTIENPDEYKGMIMDILKEDKDPTAQKLYKMLCENIINTETDLLLRTLSTIVPYNFLLPLLRDQIGLSIVTDKDCVKSLLSIRKHTNPDDQLVIDNIIDFIANDTELDKSIVPEIDLMTMLNQIPVDLYPDIYNCVDYITEITE